MQPNNKTGFTATPYNYNHQPIPLAPPMYTPAAAPPAYPNFQIQMTPAPQYYQAPYPPPQNYSFPHPTHVLHQPGPPPPHTYGAPQYSAGYCPAPPYAHPQHIGTHPHPSQNYNVAIMQRAVFDEGARFNGKGGCSLTVPPPPPGYVPTPAQIAAMQGQQVMMKKNKANFFTGGKGGGFTFW